MAVHVDVAAGRRDAVLGDHHDRSVPLQGEVAQPTRDAVYLPGGGHGLWGIGTEALEVVVQVRQIDEGKVGVVLDQYLLCGGGDPLRRCDAGPRPPVLEQGKTSQIGCQPLMEASGKGVTVGGFTPVGVVDGPGGERDVRGRPHRVPPAEIGSFVIGEGSPGGLPHLLAPHQGVVLPPEIDFAQVPKVPSVPHDAVLRGHETGEKARLHRTRNRREHGLQLGTKTGASEPREARHVLQQAGR